MSPPAMSPPQAFDFIIVGGGVMGLSAGRSLRQLAPDSRILLLDQFPLPHNRGSSHGHSRIYRVAYHHPVLSAMATASVEEWRAMERSSGERLLDNCGVLVTGRDVHVRRARDSLERAGATCESCSFGQLARDHPDWAQRLRGFPEEQAFLLDRAGGVMNAARCMAVLLECNRRHGVEIREEKVLDVRQERPDAAVTVRTSKAAYCSRAVIVTAGPWAPKFLSASLGVHLPVEPRLVGSLYWQVKDTASSFTIPNFIPLIDYYGENSIDHIYAIPEREYPDCVKFGHQVGSPVDPDQRDRSAFPKEILDFLSGYIEKHVPSVDHERPIVHEPCMYTQSADDLYVIDRHPRNPGILIATGFSGNGFKMGPIVGKILASLALNRSPGFDLQDFSLQRFSHYQAAL